MSKLDKVFLSYGDDKLFHLVDLISIQQVNDSVFLINKDGSSLVLTKQTIFNLFDNLFDKINEGKV